MPASRAIESVMPGMVLPPPVTSRRLTGLCVLDAGERTIDFADDALSEVHHACGEELVLQLFAAATDVRHLGPDIVVIVLDHHEFVRADLAVVRKGCRR